MKKTKKIITLITVVVLSMMVLTGFASAQENSSNLPATATLAKKIDSCDSYTFENFKEMLKKDINKDDLVKAEELFNKATKLDEKAINIWNELYCWDEIYNDELCVSYDENQSVELIDCELEPYTFEDFKVMLKEDLSEAELKEVEKLFDEAMKLEEAEKHEEAEKVWDKIYSKDIFDDKIENIEPIDCELEPYTFEDFKVMLKKGISEAELKEIEKLFNEAMKLEEEEKYDEAEEVWKKLYSKDIFDFEADAVEAIECEIEPYTFEDFKVMLKKDISEAELKEVEKSFNEAIKLEEEEKYGEAEEVWKKLYSKDIFDFEADAVEAIECEIEPYTFEDFKVMLKEDISEADLKEIEKLFNEAIKLEKEEKYEEAEKVWKKLYSKDIFDFEEEVIEAKECEIEPYTFEDFKVMLKEDISKADLAKAEKLFNEAMEVEQEAEKVWNELYSMDIFEY